MARMKSDELRVLKAVSELRSEAAGVRPDRFSSVVRKLSASGLVDDKQRITEAGKTLVASAFPSSQPMEKSQPNGYFQRQNGSILESGARRSANRGSQQQAPDQSGEPGDGPADSAPQRSNDAGGSDMHAVSGIDQGTQPGDDGIQEESSEPT